MTKYVVAQAGQVINIVNAPDADPNAVFWWAVDDSTTVSVGDAFDPRQFQYDAADYVCGQILFQHENRIRDLVRAVRQITSTVTGATACNNQGVPTSAQSGDVTAAQFKNAVIEMLPAVTAVAPPSYLNTEASPVNTIVT